MGKRIYIAFVITFIASSEVNALSLENKIESHEFIGDVYKFLETIEDVLVEHELIIEGIDDLTVREGCSDEMQLYNNTGEGKREGQGVCAGEVLINFAEIHVTGESLAGDQWGLSERQRVRGAFDNRAAEFLCNSEAKEVMVSYDIQMIKYVFLYNGFSMNIGSCSSNLLEKTEIVWEQQNQ